MLPVAILAGGLATRLRPITEAIPKSLVEVAGKPFLFHQLDWLHREGVRKVVLCVGHLGEKIRAEVGSGRRWGLEVDYSYDGDRLRGTGGAIKNALPKLGKAFFVLYGDSYLRCSFGEIELSFNAAAKPALMTVLENRNQWDSSNVLFEDGRLVRYDKRRTAPEMEYIDYGLSVLSAGVFESYGREEAFDLADLLAALSLRGELAGYEVKCRFYEIGSLKGIEETEAFLLHRMDS